MKVKKVLRFISPFQRVCILDGKSVVNGLLPDVVSEKYRNRQVEQIFPGECEDRELEITVQTIVIALKGKER